MLHACIGMPTFSCLPACTAACTSPNSCPGLGKIPCVTPASYDSPQAFPYPATETARGARPCATKANTHQSASYACPGTHLTSILPQRLLSAVCLPVLSHTPPLAPTPALTKPQSSLLPCIALHRPFLVRLACPRLFAPSTYPSEIFASTAIALGILYCDRRALTLFRRASPLVSLIVAVHKASCLPPSIYSNAHPKNVLTF